MDDLNELKDLKELEDSMKRGYNMCLIHVNNYGDVQRKINELCSEYGYEICTFTFNPAHLEMKIYLKKKRW